VTTTDPPVAADVSVLLAVWAGDHPDRFEDAVRSATMDQDLRPAELVLCADGPLTAELDAVVDRIRAGEFGPARVLDADQHQGLAPTLQRGLEQVRTAFVARADADDLCRPERLRLQVDAQEEGDLDLVGGTNQEFSDSVPVGTGPLRRRPLEHDQILAYLPKHSPFHHPAVLMRTETVLAVGGYKELDRLEDYWLWERMLLGGARTANLPDVLVDYRVDENLFARRGGWRLFLSDLRLQRIMFTDHVVTTPVLIGNVLRRAAYRFAPGLLRRIGYRLLVEGWYQRRMTTR
jgi:hypothetical protein